MAVLRVARDRVKESVGAALGSLPVVDLTVENPPLEEVMRDVFRTGDGANKPGST